MKRPAYAIPVIAVLLLSCGPRSSFPPIGSYSNVVIVTESGKIEGASEALIRELQHQVDYYTKAELQFHVKLISSSEFQKEPASKNVVLFGLVRRGGLGGIIESFIGEGSVRQVLEGRSNIFKRLDYPVIGQLTVIVTATSWDLLKRVVRENGAVIRNIIEEANRERLRKYLLREEKVRLREEMRAKYGFDLRIPFLYELNQERRGIPGIEFIRVKPHRGLTVSWRKWEGEGFSAADSATFYDIRSDLAWKMYDKDIMRKDLVFYYNDRFGPYDAVRMEGYWENSKGVYGGPFICFFLLDRVKSRLWMIDCVVYGPGFDKHPLLRELRAVAETFRMV